MHDRLVNATANVPGGRQSEYWPRYRKADRGLNLKNPTRKDLTRLPNQTFRENYAQGIAQGLEPLWQAVKRAGLAGKGARPCEKFRSVNRWPG